jgi:hypothetical protein
MSQSSNSKIEGIDEFKQLKDIKVSTIDLKPSAEKNFIL